MEITNTNCIGYSFISPATVEVRQESSNLLVESFVKNSLSLYSDTISCSVVLKCGRVKF